MSHGVRVRVWGDRALFSRPEMKVERCSYDVIPPSAARGILEAIYWHPTGFMSENQYSLPVSGATRLKVKCRPEMY